MTKEVEFAKTALETGVPILSKTLLTQAIEKRAGAIKRAGETDAQAFTRAITEDEDGRTLFRASKLAPGPDHAPLATPVAPKPREPGPAGRAMQALANDRLRAHPHKSPAQAYSEVYTAPANAELRDRVKREEMEAALSGAR